jgi:membrane-bound metal-dependent hydrolase YbcI (DUF457 family)
MDIFAHGLWSMIAAKTANRKLAAQGRAERLDVLLTALWGILPDLIAFTPIFAFIVLSMLFGHLQLAELRPSNSVNTGGDPLTHPPMIYWLTSTIYQYTHSLLVFLAAIVLVFLARRFMGRPRRVPWEMGGWLLHILIDIPTHSFEFYPTPFLWPLSNYRFDGYSWSHPVFQAVNYTLILFAFLYLRRRKERPS